MPHRDWCHPEPEVEEMHSFITPGLKAAQSEQREDTLSRQTDFEV